MTQQIDLEAKKRKRIHALKYVNSLLCSSIVVFSVALAAGAIVISGTLSKYEAFLHYYGSVASLCVVLGSVISIMIASWGFYAAYKQSAVLLLVFCAVLGTIVLLHATISILYITHLKSVLLATIERLFDEQMLKYDENPCPLDFVQKTLNCCGKHNATDWFKHSTYIPASCCPENNGTQYCQVFDFLAMNHEGCIRKLEILPDIITLLTSFGFCWLLILHHKDRLQDTAA